MGIQEEGGSIVQVQLNCSPGKCRNETPVPPVLEEAVCQLKEYFAGTRQTFELPLNPGGTGFMKMVWKELQKIPYGETVSYKDIAAALNSPGAARAVGMANNRNPLPILIPCHRVVGKNGALTGYRGGLDMKRALLDLERSVKKG